LSYTGTMCSSGLSIGRQVSKIVNCVTVNIPFLIQVGRLIFISFHEFSYFRPCQLFKMKKFVLCLVFVLELAVVAHAQIVEFTKPPDVDTNYVKSTWETWSLRLFTSRKTNRFAIRSKETNTTVRYVPDKIWVVGVGMAYKFVLLDVGFAFPIKGESTKRFDANLSFKFKDAIIELGYRRYLGFNPNDSRGGQYAFRADVKSQVLGIDFYHSFNRSRAAFRDLASGMQVQTKSAGSFVLGGYWSWDQIKADSSLIPRNVDEFFNDAAKINFSSQISVGVLGGYAYSLVLPKNMFFFASVAPGIGINTGEIKAVTTYNPPFFPTSRLNIRAAIGYLGRGRVYVILSGSTETTWTNWKSKNLYSYTIFQLKLAVGYRFKSEIGFLEKAAQRLERFDIR